MIARASQELPVSPSLSIHLYAPRLSPKNSAVFNRETPRDSRLQAAARIGSLLRAGRFMPLAQVTGEPGMLPNHLLRFAVPLLAIEQSTGAAWVTNADGGREIGSVFSLLGYDDLDLLGYADDAGETVVLTPATAEAGHAIAHQAERLIGARAVHGSEAITLTASRAEIVALLGAILGDIGRCTRDGIAAAFPLRVSDLRHVMPEIAA